MGLSLLVFVWVWCFAFSASPRGVSLRIKFLFVLGCVVFFVVFVALFDWCIG